MCVSCSTGRRQRHLIGRVRQQTNAAECLLFVYPPVYFSGPVVVVAAAAVVGWSDPAGSLLQDRSSGFLRRSAESVWKDLEGAVPGIPVRIPILQDHSLDPFGEALGAFGRILKALFQECLFSTIPVRIPILQDRSLPPSREALGAIGRNLRGDGGSFGRTGSFHGSCSRNPRFQRSQEESLAPPPPFPSVCVCVCVCVCVGFVVLIE